MNSKNKGNSFERKISKKLSERFKDITGIENSFRRNADSGSYFGGSNQKRTESYDTSKATFGDIICPESFKFSPECKHYKTPPSFNSIVKQDVKSWDDWISQASQDSRNSSKEFLLIVKYNGVNEIVFSDKNIDDLDILFKYKSWWIYSLDAFLSKEDNFFFNIALAGPTV